MMITKDTKKTRKLIPKNICKIDYDFRLLSKYSKTIVKSGDIQVGDILEIQANQRIPADMVILKTSEANGTCFIRTEQLGNAQINRRRRN